MPRSSQEENNPHDDDEEETNSHNGEGETNGNVQGQEEEDELAEINNLLEPLSIGNFFVNLDYMIVLFLLFFTS